MGEAQRRSLIPVSRCTTAASTPTGSPTSRLEITCSGRYEPVPIILVRSILGVSSPPGDHPAPGAGGIIGLSEIGVNQPSELLHFARLPATKGARL